MKYARKILEKSILTQKYKQAYSIRILRACTSLYERSTNNDVKEDLQLYS